MKLKYSFDSVNMGDEIIAVPVGDGAEEMHGVVKLNQSGNEIMELLKEDTTEENIINILASRYENNRKEIKEHVHLVLNKLRDAGIIEE